MFCSSGTPVSQLFNAASSSRPIGTLASLLRPPARSRGDKSVEFLCQLPVCLSIVVP
jgi:hypothetical protein